MVVYYVEYKDLNLYRLCWDVWQTEEPETEKEIRKVKGLIIFLSGCSESTM